MGFTTLFKVLKALALFIQEMWLRDRTFRQFVNENIPLILAYSGFLCMTVLFGNLYVIVRDQEAEIERHSREHASLQLELEAKVPLLTEQVAWYKERYYELKSDSVPEEEVTTQGPKTRPRYVAQVDHTAPARDTSRGKPKPVGAVDREPIPAPKPADPKPTATRPPSNDISERWKRLGE